jgi:hypothetical protein
MLAPQQDVPKRGRVIQGSRRVGFTDCICGMAVFIIWH